MKTVRSFQLVHDESETDLLAKLTFVFVVIFLSVRIIAEWLYKEIKRKKLD
jgi:preprotein translocase subunit SecG